MGFWSSLGNSLLGGASGIVGGLLGGAGSIIGQSSANKANKEIAQMNNEFNAREAQKDRDFQLDMWNKQNEYNTPAAQRARMEEAGMNPFLSDIQTGNASSSPAGAQATSAGLPTMQNVVPDFSSVASSIASMAQARKAMSDTEGQVLWNGFAPSYYNAQLDKMRGDTNWRNKAVGESGYWDSQGWNAASLDQSKERQELLNMQFAGRLTQAQETQIMLDAQAQQTLNKYLDKQQQADLFIKSQTLSNMVAQKGLTEAQMQNQLAESILASAQAKGQRINNSIADQTAKDLVRATNAANRYSFNESVANNSIIKDMTKYRLNTARNNEKYTRYAAEEQRKASRTRYWRDISQALYPVGNLVGTQMRVPETYTPPVVRGFR